MSYSRFRLEAVSLFAVALLAACGGDGSSGGTGRTTASNASGSNNSATTPAATQISGSVTLVPAAAPPPALPSPSGNATADGIAYLNAMRETLGLPALASDAGLTTTSLDHATYLADNQAYGHTEMPGLPGYTGATPEARIAAEGNYTASGEVVVAIRVICPMA